MKISNHIVNLLKLNEQVVVPGLGTFIVEYNSAKINPLDNTFSPPSKKVIFDSFTPDDNILAEYIAKNENISINEANSLIKAFAEEILTSIQQNKECDIQGLGKFVITNENQIVFIAFEKNFSDEHFGLPEFAANEVIKNNNREKAQNNNDNNKKIIKSGSAKIKKIGIISSLVVLISVVLFLIFFTDIIRKKVNNNENLTEEISQNEKIIKQSNEVPVENNTQEIKHDSVVQEKETIKEEKPLNSEKESVKKEEKPVKPEKKVEKQVVEPKKQTVKESYFLVAGSFKQEENAIKRVNELISKGYKYAGVTRNNNKGLFIVYYGAYSNREEAEKQQQIIKKDENPEAWILKN
jgi:cell division septation protein DedD